MPGHVETIVREVHLAVAAICTPVVLGKSIDTKVSSAFVRSRSNFHGKSRSRMREGREEKFKVRRPMDRVTILR